MVGYKVTAETLAYSDMLKVKFDAISSQSSLSHAVHLVCRGLPRGPASNQ